MLRVLSVPHQMTAAPERRKMFPAPLIALATDLDSINQHGGRKPAPLRRRLLQVGTLAIKQRATNNLT
jgi:hypothetical protein